MRKLRERTTFPAADGWVIFENNTGRPLNVYMEVSGSGGTIPVGAKAHVLIRPDTDLPATIIVHHDDVQIYCADAMYINGKEVLDLTDE